MFRFKKFAVNDEGATMKVGTDAVLLAALADSDGAVSVLDIGSGCGVVALIMAQRNPSALIHAVEPDKASAKCAMGNFEASPWSDRLTVFETTVQHIACTTRQKYDCIVSNPPYFRRSLKSPSEKRNMARHNDSLPFDELAAAVEALLSPEGTFTAILPCPEADEFIATAKGQNLFCQKEILVFSKPQSKPLRKVFVLGRNATAMPAVSQLAIYDNNGQYSEQYRSLTADLYLWEN